MWRANRWHTCSKNYYYPQKTIKVGSTDSENWKLEADAVMKDIEKHVNTINFFEGTDSQIYFNLTTIEGAEFCIELSGSGFRVVGKNHNKKDIDNEDYFETPYSLLNNISPQFHKSFGNELINKLQKLNNT